MRFLGVLLFLVGMTATGYSVWASFAKRRPLDLLFGLLSPVLLIAGLTGALLMFVPDFFH